jgi:putative heme-binding domain-containing protein
MKTQLIALFLSVFAAAATVPKEGLVLALEASKQAEIRRSKTLPPLGHLQAVDFVVDGSARGGLVTQSAKERRPVLISDGQVSYLKFDGKDDFLAVNAVEKSAPEITVFVLAAPKSNNGSFVALFGAAKLGANDYTSGLNLDFGPAQTKELSVLNVEGAGMTGFRDLLVPGFLNAAERPFADFHVFTVRCKAGKAGTEVFLDGFKGGERDREESQIGLDQLVIGARFYSNDPNQPPYAQGCFEGGIAEVLIYDRGLSEEERRNVEQDLLAKAVALNALLHGAKGHALEPVENPPAVQMLVPGFTVAEIPLKLVNLNNVRYRHDGKLVALGYDGRIYLLTDADGDGLEDKADLFWDQTSMRGPIGMALTSKGDPRGDGVFVASKGKVSFFLDKNRDGRADEEKVIASGWPGTFHGVDTLGVAIDPKDGSIYFGLGCANFVDAYLIDKATGRSRFDLNDIRGTIQRISPDFSERATVCTGVRFTCALAFNSAGDLFATDQEGATWLPNGNPLDELLHIEHGKHYGFPPRHPKYLPDVRDEPAVVEFGPQHQSTVGMVFNEGVNGGTHFGPAHWLGDALISGASRGKIWRTKLARTPLGYVGQNHLIACLSLITIDSCVTPKGDLLVVCHSGPPDWGTGPAGEGKIYKIRYTAPDLPQPVAAWAGGPDEFRIAFDRPLEPADWATARAKVKIEAGAHVAAGDRFEVIRPGYQIVRDQIATPRRWVEVLGLSLTEDRSTMVIRVARQTEPVTYAITLPTPDKWQRRGGIPQHSQIDLAVTLNGVLATVAAKGGNELRAVLPHASLEASSVLTAGSREHDRFLKAAVAEDASLTIRASVDVSNPFVPPLQPGSKIDWDPTTDPFASAAFDVRSDYSGNSEAPVSGSISGRTKALEPLTVRGTNPKGNGFYLVKDDMRKQIPTARFSLPWALEKAAKEMPSQLVKARTDVTGHWIRGRRVFFGEAGCATCHTIRGEGIAFGPDLSNLIHRDRESVVHDILQPSATINPDQAGSLVTFKDGTSLSGVIRVQNNQRVVLGLPAGAEAEFQRDSISKLEPLKTSLMPEAFRETLTGAQMEDLLTFLLLNPLEAAPVSRTDPPPPPARKREEVTALVAPVYSAQQERPLRILLCAGPKDHGPEEHDYPLWLERWSRLLALGEDVTVETSMGFPTAEQLAKAEVAVFYNANPGWDAAKAEALDQFHKRGGGSVYIHYAVDGGKIPEFVAERMGQAFTFGSRFRHGDFDLVFKATDHPITRGFSTLRFTDETYWNMRGDVSRLNVLATAEEEKAQRPELWTLTRFEGRVVGCIPGHYNWTFDDPLFRILVLRSICWAAKEENVDRLAELAMVGARLAE